ncbi:MAG TPA: glycosyltransferase family 2 protein [Candidatus Nanopelagicales bacterium]|nr:glycosyltransferase family 2 protein [Candidatus Nanopelagicales bacterium]
MDRSRLSRGTEVLVASGALAAWIGTAHTAYNLQVLRTPPPSPPPARERVSVLVPARDEQARIGPCLAALISTEGVDDLEILVLDDGSTDLTADIVRAYAERDERVRLITGSAPPDGWLGKPWACARLAQEAAGSVLVYVDADVTVAPHGIAASVALLRETGLDLVSPYPRQEADGALPRLVQPLLQWSWMTTLPLGAAEHSPRESLVAANGQLLVVDAAAYRRAGGHEAVRGAVLDDVALLRAVKRAGGSGVVVDGTHVATCRMYDSGQELVDGYTKSLWSAFGSPAGSTAVVALLSWLYVVPAVAMVVGPTRRARAWGAAGYTAGVVGRTLVARRTGQHLLPDVATHPASVAAFGWLVAESWRRKRSGTLTWRGRPLA